MIFNKTKSVMFKTYLRNRLKYYQKEVLFKQNSRE